MSLQPKIAVVSVAKTALVVKDNTGAYNASTNPGGFGSPNDTVGDVNQILLQLQSVADTSFTERMLDSGEYADYFGAGVTFQDPVYPVTIEDGVFSIKAFIGYNYIDADVTITEGSKAFTLTDADTVLAGCIGILIPSLHATKVWKLDPAQPLSNLGGYFLEVATASGTVAFSRLFQALGYTKMAEDGYNCLVRDIGQYAESTVPCDLAIEQELTRRILMYNSIDVKFERADYLAAHNLATRLVAYCEDDQNCNCS